MRVIAGTLKGCVLRAPKGNETRPTADRVKEALFSILGPLDGLNVLDLYAGTGSLGIEALSRGARQAVFVESCRNAWHCIRENTSRLALVDCSRIVRMRVERAWKEIANWAPYDLAFCDPPWSRIEEAWKFLAKMELTSLLSSAGRLVFEHPAHRALDRDVWTQMSLVGVRAWGDSAVTVFERTVALSET